MGRWSKLKATYPKAPLEGSYQLKVEAIKATVLAMSDEELKGEFVHLRHSKDRLKEGLTQVNAELEAVEQVFLDRMEGRGLTNQTFEDGLTLYVRDEPSFKMTDQLLFKRWLEENPAHAEEFPLTVNSATLKARLKDRLEAGDDLPPGTEIGWIDTQLQARGIPKG